MVLYSDGLVETRHDDLDAGISALERRLATASTTDLDLLVESLLGPASASEDDVTLLVAALR